MKRIVLAGLLAGVALIAWEFVSHMLLPLGETGVKALSNEQAVLAALKENVREPGFYFFPAPEDRPGMTAQQKQESMAQVQERWRTGPAGIMIFHPNGTNTVFTEQLVIQFGADLLAMLLAAILMSKLAAAGYLERAALVAVIGLFPTLQVEVPIWNWYGFPTAYMLSQAFVHLAGFCVGGAVLAKVIRPAAGPTPARQLNAA